MYVLCHTLLGVLAENLEDISLVLCIEPVQEYIHLEIIWMEMLTISIAVRRKGLF